MVMVKTNNPQHVAQFWKLNTDDYTVKIVKPKTMDVVQQAKMHFCRMWIL